MLVTLSTFLHLILVVSAMTINGNHRNANLPEDAWDSHVHVIDEVEYPFAPDYAYRPDSAPLKSLLTFETNLSHSLRNYVLVQPSVYGIDNSALLASLIELGDRGRGVVVIDVNKTTHGELRLMDNVGVRAVRINFRSTGQRPDNATVTKVLQSHASRIKHFGWAIQIYCYFDQIPQIAQVAPTLDLPIVIDHLGSPNSSVVPRLQAGYTELFDMLRNDLAWVKLSGAYRFSSTPELDRYVRDLLHEAPDRIIFASDWPHTGGVENNPNGNRTIVQPYRKVDDGAFVEQCKAWCGYDQGLIRKIFVDNPRALWG